MDAISQTTYENCVPLVMWYNASVAYILIIIIVIAKITTAAFDYPDDYHFIGILESLFSHKYSCQIGHLYFE